MPDQIIRNPAVREIKDRQFARHFREGYDALHTTDAPRRMKTIRTLLTAPGLSWQDKLAVSFEASPVFYTLAALSFLGLLTLGVLAAAGVVILS